MFNSPGPVNYRRALKLLDRVWEWLENRGLAFWVVVEMIALITIFLPMLIVIVTAAVDRFYK